MTIGETRKNERSQAQAEIPQNKQVRAPDGWTRTFTDPRLCAAIVDRLTFAGNILETGTDSYRLAQTRARAEQAS
ncbi:ATP-binding protein [Streptosporangium sp. G11]|uniref:ATP-binding protein n=1 Tax=Streptosporangium sp. G11 TaxID=3436926 RepID=UPI003EBF183E